MKAIACPRCGYDQRGIVSSWDHQSPILGQCTECGLTWWWAELLNENLVRPTWCVEYVRQWRQFPRRSFQTTLMMFRPWRFWSELRLFHEFVPTRVAAFLMFLLLCMYVMMAGLVAFGIALAVLGANGSLRYKAASIIYSGAFPYSITPPSWFVASAFLAGGRGVTRFMRPHPVVPGDYAFPPDFFSDSFAHMQLAVVLRDVRHIQDSTWIIIGILASLLIPMGFGMLPISRRRARVRWSHVWRIASYSLVFFFLLVTLEIVLQWTMVVWPRGWTATWLIWKMKWPLVVYGTPLFLCAWWSLAIRHYLRMAHPWTIGVSLVIVGYLGFAFLFTTLTLIFNG